MAVDTSLPALLSTLTQSLTTAYDSAPEPSSIQHVQDGISLLDVKNELLLSYLQNLVFLILLKLRGQKAGSEEEDQKKNGELDEAAVKKLVELRVFLEKGVRPLEGRLKYQIDKVLRAAEDAARVPAQINPKKALKSNGVAKSGSGSEDESSEEEDSAEEDDTSDNDDGGARLDSSTINDLQYRPNPSALLRTSRPTDRDSEEPEQKSDGVYRPPRISATAMPTTSGPRDKEDRFARSRTLDEFVNTELSATPLAEPSIGSNIVARGRRSLSEREKREEDERREYEERNYTRLPRLGKKERAKLNKGRRDAGYGGEEWRGLGEGLDRIAKLTKGQSNSSVLEKSRKRAVEDGPRDSGAAEIGQGFRKRVRTLEGGRRHKR